MDNLSQKIGELLKARHLTLGAVESATGGLISHRITNISGSSEYYQGSITSYSNEIKMKLVGVKKTTLEKYGAVSSRVAREMAEGGRKTLGVDICLADTGIAGPTGATREKPVGLFYLGLSHRGGTFSQRHIFKGTREENKEQAAAAAMNWLKKYLETLPNQNTSEGQTREVVTSFLEYQNKILILRRSDKVGTYQNRWAGVSGYLETSADRQARREIREETGLSSREIRLLRKGDPVEAVDAKLKIKWIIHPYLFKVENPDKIKLDWEHRTYKWIAPEEISHYRTVPKLQEALNLVMQKGTEC
jgi:nicotinamide-nucleotide amidase